MRHLVPACGVLGASLGVLSGCLVSSSSSVETSGTYISPQTMNQIDEGTTQEFVLATLGEPNRKVPMDDGSELWKWEWSERRESEGALFLVFAGESSRVKKGTAYALMRNGVVEKAWRE